MNVEKYAQAAPDVFKCIKRFEWTITNLLGQEFARLLQTPTKSIQKKQLLMDYS
jgi:hypothetical protein